MTSNAIQKMLLGSAPCGQNKVLYVLKIKFTVPVRCSHLALINNLDRKSASKTKWA